jgi:hypothetical protein
MRGVTSDGMSPASIELSTPYFLSFTEKPEKSPGSEESV